VLSPLMFLLYINDITQDINSQLQLFVDDCLLYRVINNTEDTKKLQEDLNRLSEWAGQTPGNLNLVLLNVLLYTAQDLQYLLSITILLIITY